MQYQLLDLVLKRQAVLFACLFGLLDGDDNIAEIARCQVSNSSGSWGKESTSVVVLLPRKNLLSSFIRRSETNATRTIRPLRRLIDCANKASMKVALRFGQYPASYTFAVD